MTQFASFSTENKVSGEWIRLFHKSSTFLNDKVKQSLKKNDILNASPEHWYSLQDYLNVFNEVSKTHSPSVLFKMGKNLFQCFQDSPEIQTIEEAVSAFNEKYQVAHKGTKVGYYKVIKFKKEQKEIQIECKNPYPCYWDRGILTALGKKYKPQESRIFHVELNTSLPNRLAGSDKSIYTIVWI